MSSISEQDLLFALQKDYLETQIKAGEVTIKMFAEFMDITIDASIYFLEQQYRSHKYDRRYIAVGGRRTWAYSKK